MFGLFCADGDDDERPLTPIVQGSQEHYSVEVDTKSILHLIPSDGAKPTSMISSEWRFVPMMFVNSH